MDCAGLAEPTAWLPNVRLEAERLTLGPVPIPNRFALWVLPEALLWLSVIVNVAVWNPEAVGVKVTLIVQLLLDASEVPQVLV